MKKILNGRNGFMSFLFALMMLVGIVFPYQRAEAAAETRGYLLMIEEKDGTWSEYENSVEIKSKDKLMINATEIAGQIGIQYKNKKSNTFVLSNGIKKNTYTKDAVKYQYDNGSKTVTKSAAYKAYEGTAKNAKMVEYRTLGTLIAVKLYAGKEAVAYQKAGYLGVICMSKDRKISKLPKLEEGSRVSTEKELKVAAADPKINNIIITADIILKEDFTCDREDHSVSIHIPKGKKLTISKSFLMVGGTIKNDGTILVKGSLSRGICNLLNYGSVVIEAGGSSDSGMSDLNNYGSFSIAKEAKMDVVRGSQLYNFGDLLNEGTIKVDEGGSIQDNGGKITNNGVIDLFSYYNGDISLISGTGKVNDNRKATE